MHLGNTYLNYGGIFWSVTGEEGGGKGHVKINRMLVTRSHGNRDVNR